MSRSTVRELRRRLPSKQPKLRILVVSEGAKTEGIYLSLFVRGLRAANVHIDILGRECGSDPLTVVEFARSRFKADPSYDLCYCVIDRDDHPDVRFNSAVDLARAINDRHNRREFHVIVSDPCIEFWFCLHFEFRRAPFARRGKKSRADCAIDALRAHLPRYEKTCREELAQLVPLTPQAIINATKAMEDAERTGERNPSTMMHVMIERILVESGYR